jgi:hypothetical protein
MIPERVFLTKDEPIVSLRKAIPDGEIFQFQCIIRWIIVGTLPAKVKSRLADEGTHSRRLAIQRKFGVDFALSLSVDCP